MIAGDTVTIIVGPMTDEGCTPARAQADEQLLLALAQVTTWTFRGEVVIFNGGTPLRFRVASN